MQEVLVFSSYRYVEMNKKLLLIFRRRKAREEISAAGVIEVWGLSPREAPPEYV